MKNPIMCDYLFVVPAMLLWGLNFGGSIIALVFYEPVTLIFMRLVISAAPPGPVIKIFGH